MRSSPRIFDDFSGRGSRRDSCFQKLGRMEKDGSGFKSFGRDKSSLLGGLDEHISTLADDMDERLQKAARYFEYDSEEVFDDNYSYRPDMNLEPDMAYEPKDLDLRRPAVEKRRQRKVFEVITNEVLRKADFRKVGLLVKFLTKGRNNNQEEPDRDQCPGPETGSKRDQDGPSFWSAAMGTKSFIYGKTMENLDQDYVHEIFESRGGDDMKED